MEGHELAIDSELVEEARELMERGGGVHADLGEAAVGDAGMEV